MSNTAEKLEPVPASEYEHSILEKPDYAFLKVKVPSGKSIMVEVAAMATMSCNMKMKTKSKGGLGRLLSGESMFINEFTAEGGDGTMGIAPGAPGDMEHYNLGNGTIFLQGRWLRGFDSRS